MNNSVHSPIRVHRRNGAGMKHLMRCCRVHSDKRILRVLGRFFAYRGRKYTPCPQAAASRFPRQIVVHQPTAVEFWILLATQNLCADAKGRIQTEITAHCLDAQAVLMESGLSRERALAQVLEGLGDPVQANAAFQKTYLTSWQERFVARVSHAGPTHHQVLFTAISCCCVCGFVEAVLFLGRTLRWFDIDASHARLFSYDLTLFLLFQERFAPGFRQFSGWAGRHEIEETRRWELHLGHLLDRNATWVLFALFCCLYAFLETRLDPTESFLGFIVIIVPFLYGAVHRAVIRDIIVFLPNAPRARKFLMFGYGGTLLGLALAVTRFLQWLSALDNGEFHRHASHAAGPGDSLVVRVAPVVIGLLWFGGHALVGAFFVGKAQAPRTGPLERVPQEEGPA